MKELNKEEQTALWKKMMWYKSGFWLLSIVYGVFMILFMVSMDDTDEPTTHLTPTEDTRAEFLDTTFTVQCGSTQQRLMKRFGSPTQQLQAWHSSSSSWT